MVYAIYLHSGCIRLSSLCVVTCEIMIHNIRSLVPDILIFLQSDRTERLAFYYNVSLSADEHNNDKIPYVRLLYIPKYYLDNVRMCLLGH